MYTTLEKLGLLFTAYLIYNVGKKIASFFFFYFVVPGSKLGVDLKNQGQWAVVTGATDGIGKAYAELLAKEGIDIVLISRTKSKLEAVASEIQNKYKVKTKSVEADFSKGYAVYPFIEKELRGLEIGILINNVGFAYSYPEYFLAVKNEYETHKTMIALNIISVVKMCEIVMPGMVHRRKGVVVNLSSASSLVPSPLLTVYGSSKVFVNKFSEDLAFEYEKKGIIFQCITPGLVATNMNKYTKTSFFVPSPIEYVSCALKTIGIQKLTIGYHSHFLWVEGLLCLQRISSTLASNFSLSFLEKTREKLRRIHQRIAQKASESRENEHSEVMRFEKTDK